MAKRFYPDSELHSKNKGGVGTPYEATRLKKSIFQDEIDSEKIVYKKLAKWDIQNEFLYRNMTVYEFEFHLWAMKEHIE